MQSDELVRRASHSEAPEMGDAMKANDLELGSSNPHKRGRQAQHPAEREPSALTESRGFPPSARKIHHVG